MDLVRLALGYLMWRAGWANWQTMLFTTSALSRMDHIPAVRSREFVFPGGFYPTRGFWVQFY